MAMDESSPKDGTEAPGSPGSPPRSRSVSVTWDCLRRPRAVGEMWGIDGNSDKLHVITCSNLCMVYVKQICKMMEVSVVLILIDARYLMRDIGNVIGLCSRTTCLYSCTYLVLAINDM